ncbi:outer membrane beta-barrel protein [Janthinobacterium sp. HSC-3S05]|uniref:OmpW/AlkL family protein n=1 Tax=Janthinobacterium TaxID=29580 RepID=UPI001CD8B974|nr:MULTISPECIES: OmpW family outer membrane protein [Janthinobacterium]MCA1860390.1 outer membrane beta-barrel protein [Janthinobacterium lividum]MDZ5637285.1 OmpW family outer membrane protein [Janthinobacterium sp. GMG1]
MKKSATAAAIVLAAIGAFAGNAMAQESPWLVRARAVHIDPANKSAPVGGVGASDLIHVSSKTIPEIDISYFFTPNIAAELILTYPQKHDVTLSGTKIGTFKHLPPTLSLQYHFMPEKQFSPYVGAGVNYTNISDVKIPGLRLEHDSWGFALQAGVDYKLDKNWSLNFDIKKVQIRSDVLTAAGAKISEVKVDPVLIGVGVGYRF